MERRLSVNDSDARDQARGQAAGGFQGDAPEFDPERLEYVPKIVPEAPTQATNYGPCLYFGPGGERCSRPALEGGFCARHLRNSRQAVAVDDPEGGPERTPVVSLKRMAALIAAGAALWPILADLVREILRHLR